MKFMIWEKSLLEEAQRPEGVILITALSIIEKTLRLK